VEEGAYVTITGNTIRRIVKHGVKYGNESNDNGRDGTITGNTIVGCDINDTETYSGICVIGDRVAVIGNRIDNRLKSNYTFNETGSKQLKSVEEMEPILTARLTMNLTGDTYLDYLLNGTELYLKLVLPDSKWLKFNKGKFAVVEPVLKPEDLIACRVQFEGRFLTTSWD